MTNTEAPWLNNFNGKWEVSPRGNEIKVNVGANKWVTVDKLYGPQSSSEIRVMHEFESCEWVVQELNFNNGEWVERARFNAQEFFKPQYQIGRVMSDIYFGDFNNREELFDQFSKKDCGEEILFAYYLQADYSGSALVIFRDKDNEVFEVNAHHCSCFGLENSWDPEMVVVKELKNRKMPWIFYECKDIEAERAQLAFNKVIEKLSVEK